MDVDKRQLVLGGVGIGLLRLFDGLVLLTRRSFRGVRLDRKVHGVPVYAGIRREGNIGVTMRAETNAGRVLATAERGGGIAHARNTVAIIVVALKRSFGMGNEVRFAASEMFFLARRVLCFNGAAMQALNADAFSVICG